MEVLVYGKFRLTSHVIYLLRKPDSAIVFIYFILNVRYTILKIQHVTCNLNFDLLSWTFTLISWKFKILRLNLRYYLGNFIYM